MRKKLISKTYLRDVKKYNIKFYLAEDDYYVSVKEIVETDFPFHISTGLCVIDSGYYILELIPKNENYSMRVYLDQNKKILEYYFDVSLENGIDSDTKIPYYDDLYTDVIVLNGEISILDEDELLNAYNNKEISKEAYELAIKVTENLVLEIKAGTNKYMNIDLEKYLI